MFRYAGSCLLQSLANGFFPVWIIRQSNGFDLRRKQDGCAYGHDNRITGGIMIEDGLLKLEFEK